MKKVTSNIFTKILQMNRAITALSDSNHLVQKSKTDSSHPKPKAATFEIREAAQPRGR